MIVTVMRDVIGRKQCSGLLLVQKSDGELVFSAQSLERGWLNNNRNISCIPEGEYTLRLEWSKKFQKPLWEIYDVPNRTECKLHSANYWYQLNGCISLGVTQKDFNGDGLVDNKDSRDAMQDFHDAMEGHTRSVIRIVNKRFKQ